MVVMFEVAPPFRLRPKVERFGPLVRVIWGWFSVSHIAAGVNEMAQAFRLDEREACAKTCEDLWDKEAKAAANGTKEPKYHDCIECAYAIRERSNVQGQGREPLCGEASPAP